MSTDNRVAASDIKLYLIDHPDSSAAEIATALNTSYQRVCQIAASDPEITLVKRGQKPLAYRFNESPIAKECNGQAPDPQAELAQAVAALFDPLLNALRAEIATELAAIVTLELPSMLDTLKSNVRERLIESLARPHPEQLLPRPVASPAPTIATAPAPVPPLGTERNGPLPQDIRPKSTIGAFPIAKPAEDVTAPVEPRSPGRLPKMIVAGLRQDMQALVRHEYRDHFDLRLYTKDQGNAMRNALNAGDRVIAMADYIGHRTTEIISAAKAEMIVVHGGMTALREELNKWRGVPTRKVLV